MRFCPFCRRVRPAVEIPLYRWPEAPSAVLTGGPLLVCTFCSWWFDPPEPP